MSCTTCKKETKDKKDCCPSNSVKSIGVMNKEIVITMDDCTFYKTKTSKVDVGSFLRQGEYVDAFKIIDEKLYIVLKDKGNGKVRELSLQLIRGDSEKYGIVKLANEAETLLGSSTELVTTPKGVLELIKQELKKLTLPEANKLIKGIVKIADDDEIQAESEETVLTVKDTIALIKELIKKTGTLPKASDVVYGVVKLKTEILDLGGNSLGYLVEV